VLKAIREGKPMSTEGGKDQLESFFYTLRAVDQ
jgi:hypothetical protein